VDNDEPESMLRYEKTVSLLYDMRQQGARVLAIANAGDGTVRSLASDTVEVEPLSESLLPVAEVIPLQLFAYFMAVNHGVDVDRPRNLTKAVTAE
jgi:glucosamine--fructose-6-phosphate aminotransferase (isomerizing)